MAQPITLSTGITDGCYGCLQPTNWLLAGGLLSRQRGDGASVSWQIELRSNRSRPQPGRRCGFPPCTWAKARAVKDPRSDDGMGRGSNSTWLGTPALPAFRHANRPSTSPDSKPPDAAYS